MTQLQGEGVQKEITDIWNKLGQEGEGEELKLAAHHCLLGMQDTLSHPQDYALLLKKLEANYSAHPQHKNFDEFINEIETGNYQIHFSLEKVRNDDGSRSMFMRTYIASVNGKEIPEKVRGNIETWAAIIGYDALKMDIDSVLKQLQHVPPLSQQMFKTE